MAGKPVDYVGQEEVDDPRHFSRYMDAHVRSSSILPVPSMTWGP